MGILVAVSQSESTTITKASVSARDSCENLAWYHEANFKAVGFCGCRCRFRRSRRRGRRRPLGVVFVVAVAFISYMYKIYLSHLLTNFLIPSPSVSWSSVPSPVISALPWPVVKFNLAHEYFRTCRVRLAFGFISDLVTCKCRSFTSKEFYLVYL